MSENVDEQLIMARTGHRSVGAVREYKRPDSLVQKKISDILQPPRPKVRASASASSASATVSVAPVDVDDCINLTEQSVVTSSSVVSKSGGRKTEVATKVKETSAKVVCQTDSRDTIIKVKKGEQEVEIVLK